MGDPTAKPIDHLHLETRLFVEWLRSRVAGEHDAPTGVRARLEALYDRDKGCDCEALWDGLFRGLFEQWVAEISKEVAGEGLPSIVRMILGEQEEEAPDASETLEKRIRKLREKITRVLGEDDEFKSDLTEICGSLLTYEEVLEQYRDDPRLDEILHRGVKQALMAKERDFEWLEALLERSRSAEAADATEEQRELES